MRPDSDAARLGHRERRSHHFRITCVKSASDIGRADDAQDRIVVAHGVGPKAFTHVRIQIDFKVMSRHTSTLEITMESADCGQGAAQC